MKEHPITPPPALVEQWYDAIDNSSTSWKQELATHAARWGADMELDACCEWLDPQIIPLFGKDLRVSRRPKPPSLKEQALEELETLREDLSTHGLGFDAPAIRRALAALPD